MSLIVENIGDARDKGTSKTHLGSSEQLKMAFIEISALLSGKSTKPNEPDFVDLEFALTRLQLACTNYIFDKLSVARGFVVGKEFSRMAGLCKSLAETNGCQRMADRFWNMGNVYNDILNSAKGTLFAKPELAKAIGGEWRKIQELKEPTVLNIYP